MINNYYHQRAHGAHYTWSTLYMNHIVQQRAHYTEIIGTLLKMLHGHLLADNIDIIKEEYHILQNQWREGRAVELVKGNDDLIRGARVEVYLNGKKYIIHTPMQKQIPLEINNSTKPKLEISNKEKKTM